MYGIHAHRPRSPAAHIPSPRLQDRLVWLYCPLSPEEEIRAVWIYNFKLVVSVFLLYP
jgi:hypothetical protein